METTKERKFRRAKLRARSKNERFLASKAKETRKLSKKEQKRMLKQSGRNTIVMVSDKPTGHERHKDATINRRRCDLHLLQRGDLFSDDFWPGFSADVTTGIEWDGQSDTIIDLYEDDNDGDDYHTSTPAELDTHQRTGFLPMVNDAELLELAADLGTGFRVFTLN